MSTKRQQIQWIREDIAIAEKYAKEDRLRGVDDSYQRGKADGLRAALRVMGASK